MSDEGGYMSAMNRRTFVATGASILATGASWMLVRGAEAATQHGPSHHSGSGAVGTAMDPPQMNDDMQRCIRLCRDCHARCIELLDHCVTLGGRHVAPAHIRLLMDCAQLCTVTADFMARASALHDRTCTLCAEACRRCAESCAQLAGSDQLLKQCAELCRHCAESCDRMAIHSAA